MTDKDNEILLECKDGIALLTLNRSTKMNAFSDQMRAQYLEALDEVTTNRSIRALVITGAGKGFCAGGDIAGMKNRMQAPVTEMAFNGWTRQQYVGRTVTTLMNIPKPTIAAVNGAATGLGADLAISCDFVMASSGAVFAWSYILREIIPDGGGMYFLPRRIGLSKAKELIFTGRKVDAQEALAMGIIDRISDPDELVSQSIAWAKELSRGSEVALALTKNIMNRSFETPAEQIFNMGSQAQGICYTTAEHHTSVESFLARVPSKDVP